jgi:hypothetical protein
MHRMQGSVSSSKFVLPISSSLTKPQENTENFALGFFDALKDPKKCKGCNETGRGPTTKRKVDQEDNSEDELDRLFNRLNVGKLYVLI